MAETAKERFWREWAIDGMPKDKQRLAEAAWSDATEAVRMNQTAGGEVVGYVCPRQFAEMRKDGGAIPFGTRSEAYGRTMPIYATPPAAQVQPGEGAMRAAESRRTATPEVNAATDQLIASAQSTHPAAVDAVRVTDELEATRRCALKYLEWLGIENPERGLSQDVRDPEMCGESALGQGKANDY